MGSGRSCSLEKHGVEFTVSRLPDRPCGSLTVLIHRLLRVGACGPPALHSAPQPGWVWVLLWLDFSGLGWTFARGAGIISDYNSVQFSCSVMSNSVTPWTAARQASLSITNSRSLRKLMSIESVMSSNHLILCRPLFLPPSILPSIGVFSNESVLRIRWPKYWNFSFSISPSNEYSGLISFRMD